MGYYPRKSNMEDGVVIQNGQVTNPPTYFQEPRLNAVMPILDPFELRA